VVGSCFVKVSDAVLKYKKSSSQYESYLTWEIAVHLPSFVRKGRLRVSVRFLLEVGLKAARRHFRHSMNAAVDGSSWIGQSRVDDRRFFPERAHASMLRPPASAISATVRARIHRRTEFTCAV
jgi:hypothetical protein